MPIYEYKCNNCKKDFETLVIGRFKPECPSCKSQDLSKLMSSFGIGSKSSGGTTGSSARPSSSACGSCASSGCSSCSV